MLFLNTKSHSCNAFDVWYCTGRDGVCDVWRGKVKWNHHWSNHDTKWSFVDVQKHHLVSLTQCGGLQWINWRVVWMMGWVWKVVGEVRVGGGKGSWCWFHLQKKKSEKYSQNHQDLKNVINLVILVISKTPCFNSFCSTIVMNLVFDTVNL